MTITFEAVTLPFKVGDTIYVNEKHGQQLDQQTGPVDEYFQAEIERIFFDGRLEEISVITDPVESYEMNIRTAIYVVKPIGKDQDLASTPIKLDLPIKEPKLFATEEELKKFLAERNQIDDTITPAKPD
ncbi:hypothetical protein GCM10028819_14830 [Spirosoma humi]